MKDKTDPIQPIHSPEIAMSHEELVCQNTELKHAINLKDAQIEFQNEQIDELKNKVARFEELTNKVARFEELVQQLRDEIAVLKGQKPKPKIPPSQLEGSSDKQKWKKRFQKYSDKGKSISFSSLFFFWGTNSLDGEINLYRHHSHKIANLLPQLQARALEISRLVKSVIKKIKRVCSKPGQPRGKLRKKKKTLLTIHLEQIIQPLSIPEGAIFKGFKSYDVQDITFKSKNTRYRLARWLLPDGTYKSGKLPKSVHGHYGPSVIAYILNDYYACRVTEPLLLEKLHQRGLLISSGQLNDILIHGKDSFHKEKDDLLAAGIEAENQMQTDDCGARHQGQNQYTNVIGNKWFTVFNTTDSKSRVNFFRLLQGGRYEYLINEDSAAYLRDLGAPGYLPGYLLAYKGQKFTSQETWQIFLADRNITKKTEVRLVTEAVLFASIIEKGIPRDLGVHGDDAGQFDAFVRSLCWIHEERHFRKIIPVTEQARVDLEQVRDRIWIIYKDLKAYKQNPNDKAKEAIEKQFDDLFLNLKTSSATLNKRLRMTYEKKKKLLRVFERIESPLHNNSSETDARAAVTKRKVSGGTRSDEGRDARDTFLSLKQTCRKLGINFILFLEDRIREIFDIPPLAEIIRQRSESLKAPP